MLSNLLSLQLHFNRIGALFAFIIVAALISPTNAVAQLGPAKAMTERVHLHTDRSSYSIGDTIWFKGYITGSTAQKNSPLSKVLYIDLINERDSVQKSLKLEIVNGVVYGNFALSGDLEEGLIRLRAYTKWMRNFSTDYFFDKTLLILNPFTGELSANPVFEYKTAAGIPSLSANIRITNPSGNKMANTAVRYRLSTNHETANSGNEKTDADGLLKINIPAKTSRLPTSSYLETYPEVKNQMAISKSFAINTALKDIDLQFLPEGGTLIYGMPIKIGFKAIGIDGRGLLISGTLVDELGKKLSTFKSYFAGMGSFMFTPEKGHTYAVVIDNEDVKQKKYNLPQPKLEGYTIAVTQTDDSLFVKLNSFIPTNTDSLHLRITSAGNTITEQPIRQQSAHQALTFNKNNLPYGICQITLETNSGTVYAQRIVFIKNSKKLQLNLASNKISYSATQPVKLNIKASEAGKIDTSASLSISISREEFQIKEQEETSIYSSLLLSPELKGYIESPNYYFMSDSANVNEALDNLMLTQGYREYSPSVKEYSLSTLPKAPLFKPELKGIEVTGIARNTLGSAAINARVTLLSLNAGIMEEVMSGKDGRFSVDSLNFLNGVKFTVQAKYPENTKKIRISMDNPNPQLVTPSRNGPSIPLFYPDIKSTNGANDELPIIPRSRALKEVSIQSNAVDRIAYVRQSSIQIPEGHADQTIYLNAAEKCANLGSCLNSLTVGIQFKLYRSVMSYPFYRDSAMNVILNGRLVTDSVEIAGIFDNNTIQPEDVGKVDIVRTNLALINTISSNGKASILILTKRKYANLDTYIPDFTYYIPEGYSQTANLYVPKYAFDGTNVSKSSVYTLYWDSSVHPDDKGDIEVELNKNMPMGTYRFAIEGISATGAIGRKTFRFSVK
ncbi:hypothetical protein ACVWYN_002914 [Pedobacter sp. UYP24]